MKRDMDLVRAILMAVEESDEQVMDAAQLASGSWDEVTVARHLELMIEAGLVVGQVDEYMGGGVDGFVSRLTWPGYDFLDTVRSDTVWQKTKTNIGDKVGSASFEVVKAVAAGFAMKALGL